MCERIFVEQQEEKEINARKLYDDDEDEPVDTTKGWTQEIERRKLKWWERHLYQKEVTENIPQPEKNKLTALKKHDHSLKSKHVNSRKKRANILTNKWWQLEEKKISNSLKKLADNLKKPCWQLEKKNLKTAEKTYGQPEIFILKASFVGVRNAELGTRPWKAVASRVGAHF